MEQPQLGILIADLRKKQGLTQEELVDRCNINVRTIQRIEAGEVNPRSYTIKNILEALGTTIDDVFKEKEVRSDSSDTTDFDNFQNSGAILTDNKMLLVGAISGIIYLILHSIIVIGVVAKDFADNKLFTNYSFIFLSVFCWASMALFYGTLYTYGKKQVGKLFAYSCIIFIVINAGISVSDAFYYTSYMESDSWYNFLIAIPLTFIYGLVFMFLGIGLFVERKNKRELIKWTGITGMIGGLGFATIILFPVGILGTLVFEVLLITLLFMNDSNKKTSENNSRG